MKRHEPVGRRALGAGEGVDEVGEEPHAGARRAASMDFIRAETLSSRPGPRQQAVRILLAAEGRIR